MSLKRLASPKFWKIERKTKKFVVRPLPGPHGRDSCLPLGVVLRDVLKHAYTMKEAKSILAKGLVSVDGKVKTKNGFPVGLMDIIAVGDEVYRFLPGRGGPGLKKIDKKESGIKLLRIENKVCVKKGRTQLNLHDGKNLVVDKGSYKTNDVLVFDVEGRAIKDTIKFEKGSKALVIKGNNIGSVVSIDDIIVTKSSLPNQVAVDLDGRKFTLPGSHVFVVGRDEPVIKLGEVT